jgi:hypothetical protein
VAAPTNQAASLDAQSELAGRAERVRAMLCRWAGEDVSDEPEWDVDAIASVRFGRAVVEPDGAESARR